MKAWYGANATAENNWGYDYLPKLDKPATTCCACSS
jgi:formate dehydrogenase major subunit